MTVKQKEALQRRFDKAHARTAQLVDAYKKLVNGKYYLCPVDDARLVITIDECTNEFQFLSHRMIDHDTWEPRPPNGNASTRQK